MTSRMSPSRAGWPPFSGSTTIRSRVLPTIPITSLPGISARTTAGAHPREVETPPDHATEDGIRPVPAGPDRSRPPQGAVSASQSVSLTPVAGPPRSGGCRRLTASKPAAPPAPAAGPPPPPAAGGEPLAPGVDHDWGRLSTTAGSQTVDLVEVDQSNPAIFFEASLSNGRVTGLERTSSQALSRSVEGHRVIAAINGDGWAGF